MGDKMVHLVFLYSYMMLICRTMQSCYRITDFSYISATMLFVSGILLYKLYKLYKQKAIETPRKIIFFIAVILGFLLLAYLYSGNPYPYLKKYIIDNFNNINDAIYLSRDTRFHHFLPFLILLIPVVTAVLAAFSFNGSGELSAAIMTLFMFSFWNNGFDWYMRKYTALFILISICYYAINKYGKILVKYKNTEIEVSVELRKIILYSVVLSLIVTVNTLVCGRLFGTKSISQLENALNARRADFLNFSKKEAYDLTYSGYSKNEEKLGGPIILDGQTVFRVKSDEALYLKGTVKDYYDGYRWNKAEDYYTKNGRKSQIEVNPGFIKLLTGVPDESTGKFPAKQPLKSKELVVYPERLATSTLFCPSNTINIKAGRNDIICDKNGTFLLIGEKTVSEPYKVKYYKSSTGIEIFSKAAGTIDGISYENDNLIKKEYSGYLQLPDNITPMTYALVDSIIKDCSTVDEKVNSIMRYLKENYPYSLDVEEVPDDREFIDYFLFTEKKGYCTYFATTATVFCRMAGIPARYVEGFHMNEEKDSTGKYVVSNDMAHAWTEVLISPENNIWSIVDCVPEAPPVLISTTGRPYEDKFNNDWYKQGRYDTNIEAFAEQISMNAIKIKGAMQFILYPIVGIPLLILLILLIYMSYRILSSITYKKQIISESSIIPLYQHSLKRLETIGLKPPPGLCELEFIQNLEDEVLGKYLQNAVNICYEEYYGDQYIKRDFDRNLYYKSIEKHIRKKQNLFVYLYYRFLKQNKIINKEESR